LERVGFAGFFCDLVLSGVLAIVTEYGLARVQTEAPRKWRNAVEQVHLCTHRI
jgi:hypothetical protein